MTVKKINKKLIVVPNQGKLAESDVIQDSKDKVNAQIEFPTIVPGIDPAAADVQTKITNIEKDINRRNILDEESRALTEKINAAIFDLKSIFVDNWAIQIQKTPGMDVSKVKQLKFFVKGFYDGESEPVITVENSHPQLDDVIETTHLKHILHMVNSTTKKVALPDDAEGIDVFGYFGAQPPEDYHDMKYLGRAVKGNYTVNFKEADLGKTIWYFTIYVPRKKSVVAETASKVKAIVM